MQDAQLYVQGEKDVVGTIVFAQTDVITSNVMDFTQNTWVIGNTIVNNTTGVRATILSVVSSTNIQLSITGFATGGLEFTIIYDLMKVDFFKDETISLTKAIKNVKDISKIQTSFSQKFTVPASKTNNKIFRHFYNNQVQEGFNASILKNAKIKLNGIDFEDGKIRFLGVKMKDNKPYAYSLNFIGNTVSLKDIFKEDEISELPYLDVFNHDYTYANVLQYMNIGFNFTGSGNSSAFNPDMMYPFISAKSRYYYNTDNTVTLPEIENVRNIYSQNDTITNNQADYKFLNMYDFKPAIKVYYVLKAMEQKYGFTFSNDFIKQDSDMFEQMYMWCNREAGTLFEKLELQTNQFKLSELTLVSGDELRYNSVSFYRTKRSIGGGRSEVTFNSYSGTITPTGSGRYDLLIYDEITNRVYYEAKNITGVRNFSRSFDGYRYPQLARPVVQVTSMQGISSFSLSNLSISNKKYNNRDRITTTLATSAYSMTSLALGEGITFRKDMLPKIKVLDFLKGMFNMFNLIAYFEGTQLVVKTLDDYYLNSNHKEYNLDKYVDSSNHQVNRSQVYSEINYEFEKTKTLLAIKSNELTGDEFGNERFKSEGDSGFDGKKFDVKVKFGKMIYENLVDGADGSSSGILWGYSVDKDENPVLQAPTLFINQRINVPVGNDIYFTDKPVGIAGSGYDIDYMSFLMTPSNYWLDYSVDSSNPVPYSLNYGSEFAPIENLLLEEGLFKTYHQNFIENIYEPNARMLKITAHLPLSLLLKYNLNDRFIIRGQRYLINSAKTNLQTGKSELELLTDNYGI
tara:strand:+ start:1156 stop:3552 length:2397 start_codon:yes stop_codon:yes gene_type:complete